ncbi:hypothetical protein HRG_009490 [Hirsutella rhossiliensis]|uniref:Mid2 domain-containing protein n=1 Tax=Hirsutella rhossiliensis TaxID=111463 RepID=A0A9P8MQ53_9HYPO|nr:uncharacterized protein HRG_09490 [Hirsutella rhossiliensis]KAH0959708.1 hypothetical protein HRG_09490 [Hirsutella rhossiliensis]
MRLPLGLVLGALLGVARADVHLFARQNRATSASPPARPPVTSDDTPPATSAPVSPNPGPGAGGGGGGDVTITSTITVTSGAVSTTTQWTTVTSTTTTVSTVFSTATITGSITGSQATATSTVFETSTVPVDQNRRRALDPPTAPRLATPAQVEAVPTRAPVSSGTGDDDDDDDDDQDAPRLNLLAKRATSTQYVTSTASANRRVTATATATSFSLENSLTTIVVTQTDQPNARTTVTVTSTLAVTSTRVTSLVEGTPTEVPGSDGGSGASGASGASGDGLSTGAKAGIGVGAGIGALALIGAAALCFLRRRKSPKPVHDDFMGASEVPVGGPGGRGSGSQHMSESTSAGGYLAPSHSQHKPGGSVEGYRGTAMGDGRAGYANNLTPYGAAYTPSRNTTLSQQQQHRNSTAGDNQLPRHPTPGNSSIVSPLTPETAELGNDSAAAAAWNNPGAAEIDGQPVMSHHSGPVYEMPTQSYR